MQLFVQLSAGRQSYQWTVPKFGSGECYHHILLHIHIHEKKKTIVVRVSQFLAIVLQRYSTGSSNFNSLSNFKPKKTVKLSANNINHGGTYVIKVLRAFQSINYFLLLSDFK